MKYIFFLVPLILSAINCRNTNTPVEHAQILHAENIEQPQAISLLGKELNSPIPSEKITNRWKEKKLKFDEDPQDIDNIIWYGRFTAYIGDYTGAIDIYTKGMDLYPNEPRLYRHRGHRYISIRKLDEAIQDFKKAEELIKGTENSIEPDGMPNARNIPVSTLHGNIYYHLGLSYYLKNNLPNALTSFQSCLNTSSNSDNVVSATHWIHMILRRLNKDDEAKLALERVNSAMDIIENHSYYDLCQFYKNAKNEGDLINPESAASANDAVKYGIANWYLYNGQIEKGTSRLKEIVNQPSWASFGYIAAEADLSRM